MSLVSREIPAMSRCRVHTPHEVTAPGREDEGGSPDTVVDALLDLVFPFDIPPSQSLSHICDGRLKGDQRLKNSRLCLALGTGEPGNGAKGQDEEEADQKTPPVLRIHY